MAVCQKSRLLIVLRALMAAVQGAPTQVASSPTRSILGSVALSTSALVPTPLSSLTQREVVTSRVTSRVTATLAAATILTVQKSATSTVPLQLPSSTGAVSTVNSTNVTIIPEFGQEYGNLIFRNNCPETLHLFSVGVRRLGGYRKESEGYGTPEDNIPHHIAHGETYTEPYRITCPDVTEKEKYCPSMDKVAGQGVAIKISRNENVPSGDIFQFEYALVKDPKRGGVGDKFYRMNYDISLLDCARADGVTDVSGTGVQHAEKVKKCPGYEKGLAVTFDEDPDTTNCPPVYCAGEDKCMMIYTWDRTREGEMSLACDHEYRGNMTVDLCVKGNDEANGQAADLFAQWGSTARNIPPGALMQLPTSMSIARVHHSTSPLASGFIASTFPPSVSGPVAVPSTTFSRLSLSTSPASTSIVVTSPPVIPTPVVVVSSLFLPPSPSPSPSSTSAADARQEPPTLYSNCYDVGPSTLKTCYITTTSSLTGFAFPTPPTEDTQEFDGSDPTDLPTPPAENTQELDDSESIDIPTPTPTDDMPEEAQTDMPDAPEPTSEAVPTLAEMTAVVITTSTLTYSTDGHGMIVLPAAKTNLVADM